MVRAKMLRSPDNQSWPDEKSLWGPDSCRRLYPSSKDAEDGATFVLPYASTSIILGTFVAVFFAM
ncbi:LOW QUALITY PROTEIN: uncharacterized protein FPRO_02321 [Fusarium proliferatum ET1]|uniref:Uncharacterized protein n=1 Tax=Fusarium proliferatum (strain ET1) TaxID=1227346 RepID=A0A1L7V9G2_FUSPR|nr:LOW QUALITY PROTEIN: uncharacterized protein FPRO_02321 [Fusarium proliferatum ET1]CZR37419.1 uncharacterized protein FPRO_02321 [Fusarium proliferatum ET1]